MEVKRDKYLKELISKRFNGMVKVITGMRRSGKSYLLFNLFGEYLCENGVSKENIIRIELDQISNIKYRNPIFLDEYIRECVEKASGDCYLFVDEIQFVESVKNPYVENGKEITFYDVLNGLMRISGLDVYVTGSNSKMLSSDILTEFRGRGDEVHVAPLTFFEFMSVYDGDKYDGWLEYYTYGGMPAIIQRRDNEHKAAYLNSLFEETYIKDIVERNGVKNVADLKELLNVLSSSIGSLTNALKLESTFRSVKKSDISKNTIDKYIEHLEDSFLIKKAMRYDVKGRKYINTPVKYYFTDVGLRNVRLNFRQQEENHIMENIIYNELIYRGYHVDVGIVEIKEKNSENKYQRKQLEVDFIATKGSEKYYIQSALSMQTEEKVRQEQKSLINIDDHFKKIVVVKDNIMLKRDEKGIVTMSVLEFLLKSNSLEL
ncbi:MAG: ATP-binding protein [Bacillota bacterium]